MFNVSRPDAKLIALRVQSMAKTLQAGKPIIGAIAVSVYTIGTAAVTFGIDSAP